MSHFEMVIRLGLFLNLIASLVLVPALCTAASTEIRLPASINRAALMVAAPSKIFYGENGKALSPEMIATFYQVKSQDQVVDVGQIIPMDLPPTQDTNYVLTRVADRSLNSLWNSQAVRASSVGRAATTVEEKMKQEVVIGGNEPKSIQHKFNFNVQAFQALAQIEYSGFTHAALRYKLAESALALEVFEKVGSNQDIILSHVASPLARNSNLSFRWNF